MVEFRRREQMQRLSSFTKGGLSKILGTKPRHTSVADEAKPRLSSTDHGLKPSPAKSFRKS
jgi:hypothetical protein